MAPRGSVFSPTCFSITVQACSTNSWLTRHSGITRWTKSTTSQVQPTARKAAKKTASPMLPASREPVRRLPRFFS